MENSDSLLSNVSDDALSSSSKSTNRPSHASLQIIETEPISFEEVQKLNSIPQQSFAQSEDEFVPSEDEYVPSEDEAEVYLYKKPEPSVVSNRLRSLRPRNGGFAQTATMKRGASHLNDSPCKFVQLEDDDFDIDDKPKKKKKRRQVIESDDDEDEESQFIDDDSPFTSKPKKQLTTILAENEEKARRMRLAEKQREFNGIEFEEEEIVDLDLSLNESFNTKHGKTVKSLVLDKNSDHEVKVHKSLVNLLKPHQAQGIQFMYNCTIESLDRLDRNGGGGILAHCMGLGKTFQSIAFLHTIMTDPIISDKIKHAMIVCPKNVIINWENEFQKWTIKTDATMKQIELFEIDSKKDNKSRLKVLKEWHTRKNPSVLIIGYESYRNLTQDYTKPNKKTGKIPAQQKSKKPLVAMQPEIRRYLQNPGPDIVICDEGHKLKNIKSEVSLCISELKTKRRICLTGTPMQNNLTEYYCMVNFVKEGLLGSVKEFKERFENPIKAGQTIEAGEFEVTTMRRRCFVLFKKLEGIIDRQDFSVLEKSLRPKLEYVIALRLSDKQLDLYRSYVQTQCETRDKKKNLLAHYYTFSRIFTHPYQIVNYHNEQLEKAAKNLDDFIADESSGSEDNGGNNGNDDFETNGESSDWYVSVKSTMNEEDRDDYTQSYKLLMMIELLKKCETVGDKVLIFSQSLETLRLIEQVLANLQRDWFVDGHEAVGKNQDEKWGWVKGKDYFLITGNVDSKDRNSIQQNFNRLNNPRARVCLISTKAGSLGTNFVGANRVIVFDQNWNPSHDRQALFRSYRFGQTKPTYIYRFVAYGTIEQNIYSRQVTKESISARVIDENQIKRHYSTADLDAFYVLKTDEYDPSKPPKYTVPEDKLLASVFVSLKEGVVNCVQHDSLLVHQVDEELNDDERALAWQEFESRNPTRKPVPAAPHDNDLPEELHVLNETDEIEIDEVMYSQRAVSPMESNDDNQRLMAMLSNKKS